LNSSDAIPLSIRNLTFTYRIRQEPAIQNINLDLHEGELMLLAGSSGCGKTTLMRCVNGLIPRIYTGKLEGEISLYGKSANEMRMSDLAQIVGTLLQDPERQIVGSYVLNDVAFGLENLALPREEIRERVDEALDYLGILNLRDRETFGLSGGERQKVALAGVLAMRPKILLLDEPLASLDPASAEEALILFRRLANEGISIMLVEHRVEDVLAINPDTYFLLEDGISTYIGEKKGLMEVVDYKRFKLPAKITMERAKKDSPPDFAPAINDKEKKPLVEFKDVCFRYAADTPEVLHHIDFNINSGDIIAILGHNGAGKSTLVKHALGLLKPTEGQVIIDGRDSHEISVARAAKTVGYVFQSPSQMLFAPTVKEELEFGPKNLRMPKDEIQTNVEQALQTVHMKREVQSPPLALSFGQQKRVSIAAVLAMRSQVLMMDEPTAGQDYWNYMSFMDTILQMPGFGSIIFITHDLDLSVIFANRILLLYNGSIVADGSPFDVLKDEELLRHCRVLPTSLLELNLELYPKTHQFMRAEALAHV
jgi:energy-coupling factor transport system ATP-binding protein